MKALLIGYGEVGKGVYSCYSKHHDIDIIDPFVKDLPKIKNDEYIVMLVCLPYNDDFVNIVNNYASQYNPNAIIVFSTVPIGTTKQIKNAVHSPVEGKHPHLGESMERFQRFIGGINTTAMMFFLEAGQHVLAVEKPEFTEFLKMQSTSNYGLMIEYARYVKSVCDDLGMDYNYVKAFNTAYNNLYEGMGYENIKRYILDPPVGALGGHCVKPNAILLDAQYPSDLLKEIYKR